MVMTLVIHATIKPSHFKGFGDSSMDVASSAFVKMT